MSKGELDILKAFTQFLPRLLEQSLFSSYLPSLNGDALTVYFNYVKFDSQLLAVYDYLLNGSKAVDLYDVLTGDHLRRVASISAASLLILGNQERRHIIKRHLGALSGIK